MSSTSIEWRRALTRAAGLGFVAGGVESVGLAASSHLALGFFGFLAVGLAAVVSMGLLAVLVSVPAKLFVDALWGDEPDDRTGATMMAVVGTVLCAWYLWGASLTLIDQGRTVAGVVFAMLPFPFALIVSFNARYWLRRSRRGDTQTRGGRLHSALALRFAPLQRACTPHATPVGMARLKATRTSSLSR